MFLSNFAHKIGVCHDTLLEWCKRHPEFSEAYTCAKELQKQHLIECGLLGLFNSKFAIFTAKNITDMRDKQEIEHDIKGLSLVDINAQMMGGKDGSENKQKD